MKLEINALTFGYSNMTPALRIPELTIDCFPLAVLGPNGAGKSTFLALLAGRFSPNSGSISLSIEAPQGPMKATELRQLTSWMPQHTRPLRGFSVREYVAYAGWLKGIAHRDAWTRAPEALASVGLTASLDVPTTKLSGGQLRRLGIASAIVSNPQMLLLDEPHAGLDPEQRGILRASLLTIAQRAAIVVATHQTDDLEQLFRSVVVVDSGSLIFAGTAAEFLGRVDPAVAPGERAERAYRSLLTAPGSKAGA